MTLRITVPTLMAALLCAAPAAFAQGVAVDPRRELMITDLSVVEDPVRTQGLGAWTFGRLMADMAGDQNPSAFILRWLRQWEVDQQINGFTVPARPNIRTLITQPWIQRSGGLNLDLAQAPFRLLAIVNRIDLREVSSTGGVASAGEGRFVFGALDPNGNPLPFTVILEYHLLANTPEHVLGWANAWHTLGRTAPGPRFNRILEFITRRFAGRDAAPNRINGSAISQVRTNEIALSAPWQLREFVLADNGRLTETTVKQTPDFNTMNGTTALADLINQNEQALLDGSFVVPDELLAGEAPVPFGGFWSAPGINDNDARHALAVNTCNGCHSPRETGTTTFTHVSNRTRGNPAALSGFLTGIDVNDPVSGQVRSFNDLARRAEDLSRVLSGDLTP